MEVSEKTSGRVIKAKKLKDGFSFQLSIDHIIEQTLLKEYNSPRFSKTTIRIEDSQTDEECETAEMNESAKPSARSKGVPIKLQLKRQYAEDSPSPDADSTSGNSASKQTTDEPLDMSTKKIKKDKITPAELLDYNMITPIPLTWMFNGLSRADHKKFQSALSNASSSPFQRKNKSMES
ncbi:uncharacterized protein [Watersipora subatra]|uniref:uncharacterized protein n=1 Tax=Watersipora subatra TaxID=2589382 RepID=UPI00355C91B2